MFLIQKWSISMSISSERVNQGFCPGYDCNEAIKFNFYRTSNLFQNYVENDVNTINYEIGELDACTSRIAKLSRMLFISSAMIGLSAVAMPLIGTVTLSQAGLLIFAVSMAVFTKRDRDSELSLSNELKGKINKAKKSLDSEIVKFKYLYEHKAVECQFQSTDQSIPSVTYQIDEWSEPVIPNLDVRNNFKKIEISQWKRASNAEMVKETFRPWFELYCKIQDTQAEASRAIIRYLSRDWSRTNVDHEFGFGLKGILAQGQQYNYLSPERFAEYMKPT